MTNKKTRTSTQFNMFDEPTVTKHRKPRPSQKMSDWEKEEIARKKKAEKEREIDKKYSEQGREQLRLFAEQYITPETIKEEVDKILNESEEND